MSRTFFYEKKFESINLQLSAAVDHTTSSIIKRDRGTSSVDTTVVHIQSRQPPSILHTGGLPNDIFYRSTFRKRSSPPAILLAIVTASDSQSKPFLHHRLRVYDIMFSTLVQRHSRSQISMY